MCRRPSKNQMIKQRAWKAAAKAAEKHRELKRERIKSMSAAKDTCNMPSGHADDSTPKEKQSLDSGRAGGGIIHRRSSRVAKSDPQIPKVPYYMHNPQHITYSKFK